MEYLVSVFALFIGCTAVWFSLKFIRLYLRVKKWHRVQAKVISKELIIHPRYSTSRSPYAIKANYRYHFDGIDYSCHLVDLLELETGQVNHMKSTAEKKLNRISQTMSIFVNPSDPTQAVMFCDGIGLYSFVLCIGLFCLLITLTTGF